ncbi:MAG TPA: maltotransferase domain-containing protein, partial [Steroidobacteraceae bacterium]|nr:maltotransferase domain-containing protein [Steroidobacteraceae bacterium]
MATRVRAVVENITPQVDCGRFSIKRTTGEEVVVEADVFADGHDCVSASLLYRQYPATQWRQCPMREIGNDRWQGSFTVGQPGAYEYAVAAWIDQIGTWRRGLIRKHEAGQNVDVELRQGAALLLDAASRASGSDAERLREWAAALDGAGTDRVALVQDEALHDIARQYPESSTVTESDPPLEVWVDRERARFSTWYEMFPRSAAPETGRHGTFTDLEGLLPYVASMGFDVLYLPPIHPIGVTDRKGPDNAPSRNPQDPGSPWAIGSGDGGHREIHPQLGTLEDFRRLVAAATAHGIELALDLAFQATPDHPYVREH